MILKDSTEGGTSLKHAYFKFQQLTIDTYLDFL